MKTRFLFFVPPMSMMLLLAPAPTASAQPPPRSPAVESIEKVLGTWMSGQGIPGLSIAIIRDGQTILENGYGMADLENFVPAKASTVFRTASMGKPMTATAAMHLAEARKLDLDAPVQRYCPAFPARKWPLTTRGLLRHVSGIRHYGGPHDQEEQFSTKHYASVVDSLQPFKDDPLKFEPGTEYSYSTYGYDVIGCAIEGASGMPYLKAMQALIFDPSRMPRTRDDDPSVVIPNRAAGYVRENGSLRNAPHVDMSNRLPAGGFLTTAGDLARFGAAFIDCKLVSCATRDAMLVEYPLKNGDTVNYGLGWALEEDLSGRTTGRASHGGSSPGASGILFIVPRERLSIAILTNLESAPQRDNTVAEIADIVLGASNDKVQSNK
ncbi:MAG: serine hydrolase domain-containing protein [Acidobacteriota bacterium]